MIFVDGQNFYISTKELGIKVDIAKLKTKLIHSADYHFQRLHYYTASFEHNNTNPERSKREERFLVELERIGGVELHRGEHHARNKRIDGTDLFTGKPSRIDHRYQEEKMTDVSLAVDMVYHAQADPKALARRETYDVAMLVSDDMDFVPAVSRVREMGKTVVWCQINAERWGGRLGKVCDSTLQLTRGILHDCIRRQPPTLRR